MLALPRYRAAIEPAWIDYNGHLRDAYYAVILSLAIDAAMDHLGLDAGYRERTGCTLYTLELHMHYLHEVKHTDVLELESCVLDADRKRIHLGSRFSCDRVTGDVATAEAMLLHVQQGAQPTSAVFPPEIEHTVRALTLDPERRAAWGPGSRKIELKRR